MIENTLSLLNINIASPYDIQGHSYSQCMHDSTIRVHYTANRGDIKLVKFLQYTYAVHRLSLKSLSK